MTRTLRLTRISITSLIVHTTVHMQLINPLYHVDGSRLLRAFTAYVRPLLEYASPVRSTKSAGLIKTIESVQRRFTASLPGCKYPTYIERLKLLHIDSLEKHRLIIMYLIATKRQSEVTQDTVLSIQSHNKNPKRSIRKACLEIGPLFTIVLPGYILMVNID